MDRCGSPSTMWASLSKIAKIASVTKASTEVRYDAHITNPPLHPLRISDFPIELIWELITNPEINRLLLSQGVVLHSLWGDEKWNNEQDISAVRLEETMVDANQIHPQMQPPPIFVFENLEETTLIPSYPVETSNYGSLPLGIDMSESYYQLQEVVTVSFLHDQKAGHVNILNSSLNHITTYITYGNLHIPWIACLFYGSPYKPKDSSWNPIRHLSLSQQPILIIGDMNIIRSTDEQQGGREYEFIDSYLAHDIMRDQGWANLDETRALLDALNTFYSITGQEINFEKSGVHFSKNTGPDIAFDIRHLLNMRSIHIGEKYLGSPLFLRQPKSVIFNGLITKVNSRMAAVTQVIHDKKEASQKDEAEQAYSSLDPYNAKRRHWRRTKLGF
ncbi:hypothetical protein IFM89_011712 [Coptis chinensis]|uniref:Endonuclease/exonuclease/phosphatase domain-containing protein n=1 Tax=Coptis chinensis TaxID=261450 RepID=A0A835IZS8_9MAGN|nr:hypothetical protein IFM89_011712 [Coptis chinensis]